MENLKKMMVMLICMGIMATITSCLGDDDNNNTQTVLTASQKSAQIYEMSGNYNGYVYFTNDSTLRTDSSSCVWRLAASDSALVIPNFPVAILANGVNDNVAKKCLLNGGTTTFKGVLHPYYNTNNSKSYYTYWMLVDNDKMEFTIENEGTSHNVTVNYVYQMVANNGINYSTFYSVGDYLNGEMLVYILVKDVIFDNKTFTTGWASYIFGKKQTL